jgi:hypothetical protein
MPIEQRSKLLLVINMKTAKALGLTAPQSLQPGSCDGLPHCEEMDCYPIIWRTRAMN